MNDNKIFKNRSGLLIYVKVLTVEDEYEKFRTSLIIQVQLYFSRPTD